MTSKERVRAALARKPVDRVPVYMWFHPETAARLGRELGIAPGLAGEAMGNDVCQTWIGNNHAMEGVVLANDGDRHLDEWGVEWVREGAFNQIASSPLATADATGIRGYAFPTYAVNKLVGLLEPLQERATTMFMGADVSPCAFELAWRLRGMEQTMLDLATEPELMRELFARAADFCCQLAREATRRYELDWLWTGDDAGSQLGMMMSPAQWRQLVKPGLARVVAVGKAAGVYVAFHSCGGIRPIIPDLIEIGVDVLNPLQGNCPGMDPAELKAEFGDQLAFMGGVDTQELLPKASADEVRAYAEELLATMTAGGGGYILAASHTVPPETPLENIWALYAAAGISRDEIMERAAALRTASPA